MPTNYPDFAQKDTLLTDGTPNKVRPQEALRDYGYDVDTDPTAQEMNWMFNNINEWLKDIDNRLKTTTLTLADVYPVGSLYCNFTDDRNPADIFEFGTWVPAAVGRMILGTDADAPEPAYPLGATGGEAEHTLTIDEMPAHTHSAEIVRYGSGYIDYKPDEMTQKQGQTGSAGSGQPHNNMPPYVSARIWQRTA